MGRLLTGGELIGLEGALGSGKTHLIQGLARGLGIRDQRVTSPTFVFIREFRGRCPLAHVDLFRIEREEDLLYLGVLEYLDSPWVVAVEWADRAPNLLPAERLSIRLMYQDEKEENIRRIEIETTGSRYQKILAALGLDGNPQRSVKKTSKEAKKEK